MEQIEYSFSHQLGQFCLELHGAIPLGGITAVVGPSGAGKSSFLRLIAGLTKSKNGLLKIGHTVWQNDQIFVPTYKREIGFVFQDPSLFPHLSVAQNLKFGYQKTKEDFKIRKFTFENITKILKLGTLLNRSVGHLSGGEKQRVALGRALLTNPKLLLLDEPLNAMDLRAKEEILQYLQQICKEYSMPMLFVSHTESEIQKIADRRMSIEDGKLVSLQEAGGVVQTSGVLKEIAFEEDEIIIKLSIKHLSQDQSNSAEGVRMKNFKIGEKVHLTSSC